MLDPESRGASNCHPYQFLEICIALCNNPIGLIQKNHLRFPRSTGLLRCHFITTSSDSISMENDSCWWIFPHQRKEKSTKNHGRSIPWRTFIHTTRGIDFFVDGTLYQKNAKGIVLFMNSTNQ